MIFAIRNCEVLTYLYDRLLTTSLLLKPTNRSFWLRTQVDRRWVD